MEGAEARRRNYVYLTDLFRVDGYVVDREANQLKKVEQFSTKGILGEVATFQVKILNAEVDKVSVWT